MAHDDAEEFEGPEFVIQAPDYRHVRYDSREAAEMWARAYGLGPVEIKEI